MKYATHYSLPVICIVLFFLSSSVVFAQTTTSTQAIEKKYAACVKEYEDAKKKLETNATTSTKKNAVKEKSHSSSSNNNSSQQVLPIITSVVINEVLPNPKGTDSEDEFIEIKNASAKEINLDKWKLADATKKRFTLKNISIGPHEIIVFKRTETNISLNNSGKEDVRLFDQHDRLVEQITYEGKVEEDQSYARGKDNLFFWTKNITPGFENKVVNDVAENHLSENTTTSTKHTTTTEQLKIKDSKKREGSAESSQDQKKEVDADNTVSQNLSNKFWSHIEISEFIPNPIGSDDSEFIELYNPTETDIDISSIQIDDEEGGSKPYTIPDNTIIQAKKFLVFQREDTGLALNNTGDAVRLLLKDGKVLQQARYEKAVEGVSYIKDEDGDWVMTDFVTPGEENKMQVVEQEDPGTIEEKDKPVIETMASQISQFDVGDRISIQGVVGVLPGVYGSQYFYIAETDSASTTYGVQIYQYKKEFPDLHVGDAVQIIGEMSETQGEARIKVKTKEDIVFLEDGILLSPVQTELANVSESTVGSFVKVKGEITELKGSYMYIDDGTAELRIYFKRGANISKEKLKLGDIVTVVGFVNKTKQGYQVLPRSQDDIKKIGVAQSAVLEHKDKEKESQKEVAEKYLTATAGGLTSLIVGLFAKTRGAIAKGIMMKLKDGISFVFK